MITQATETTETAFSVASVSSCSKPRPAVDCWHGSLRTKTADTQVGGIGLSLLIRSRVVVSRSWWIRYYSDVGSSHLVNFTCGTGTLGSAVLWPDHTRDPHLVAWDRASSGNLLPRRFELATRGGISGSLGPSGGIILLPLWIPFLISPPRPRSCGGDRRRHPTWPLPANAATTSPATSAASARSVGRKPHLGRRSHAHLVEPPRRQERQEEELVDSPGSVFR